jgi:hypothetical protein
MTSHTRSTIFIVDEATIQNIPIIRALIADKKYAAKVFTLDTTSRSTKTPLELSNVSVLEGSFVAEDILRTELRGCDGAFINIDGFNSGEKIGIVGVMRGHEFAIEEGVKFLAYGNMDYLLNISRNASIPPTEMAMASTLRQGVGTRTVPPDKEAAPHAALAGCGYYARWFGLTILGASFSTLDPFAIASHAALWAAGVVTFIAVLTWWLISQHNPLHRIRPEQPSAEQEDTGKK